VCERHEHGDGVGDLPGPGLFRQKVEHNVGHGRARHQVGDQGGDCAVETGTGEHQHDGQQCFVPLCRAQGKRRVAATVQP